MPSDETRRVLKAFGAAVTAYEDAVRGGSPAPDIGKSEQELRERLADVMALIDRLREGVTPP